MYGSSNGGQRRAPFTGGIWASSPFLGGGGRAYRPRSQYANPLMRSGYDDWYGDEDELSYDAMRGGVGPMGAYGGGNALMRQNFPYTSYQDLDGDIREQGYCPGGPYGNSMGPRRMNILPGGLGRAISSMGGRRAGGGRFGPFMSSFWTGGNPFRGPNDRADPAGFSGQEHGVGPNGVVAFGYNPAPLPRDNELSEENAMVMAEFLQQHTQPFAEDRANAPPNSECPICLEPPSASHFCVQIKDIPGCNHMIGRDCLRELLIRNSDEKKECPLCRTEFVGSNLIEQRSDRWNHLAQGRGGPARGPSQTRVGYSGAPPRSASCGLPSGMPSVRGMGNVGRAGQGDGPPMARGPLPGNFNGGGQRLGGPQSGYYQQQYAPNFGDGTGYYDGPGGI